MTRTATLLALVLSAGCGGAQPTAAEPAMPPSARERSAATQQRGGVQVGTVDPARTGGPPSPEEYGYEPLWFSWRVDGSGHVLAQDQVQHARVNAQGIAAFTGKACRNIPPEARSACPVLAALHSVKPVPGGFLVRFEAWVDLPKSVELMHCHVAFARATGYRHMPFCPLYLPGLEVERRGDAVFFGIDAARRSELLRRLESHVAKDEPVRR